MSFTILSISLSQVNANETNKEDDVASVEEIQQLDPYVTVENNQFKLVIPHEVKVDERVAQEAEKQLSIVNEKIIEENAIINPIDKSVLFNSGIELRKAGLPAHQPDTFWWGARHIFRTKAAANKYAKDLKAATNHELIELITIIAPPANVLKFITKSVANDMAKQVTTKIQKYKKIELDIPWSIVGYRVIEWKD